MPQPAPIDYDALTVALRALLDDTVAVAHGVGAAGKAGRLDMVAVAAAACECCRQHLDAAVGTARAADASWAEVGHVLGVSRQAACQRFGT